MRQFIVFYLFQNLNDIHYGNISFTIDHYPEQEWLINYLEKQNKDKYSNPRGVMITNIVELQSVADLESWQKK